MLEALKDEASALILTVGRYSKKTGERVSGHYVLLSGLRLPASAEAPLRAQLADPASRRRTFRLTPAADPSPDGRAYRLDEEEPAAAAPAPDGASDVELMIDRALVLHVDGPLY
jgi:hypothetical protein